MGCLNQLGLFAGYLVGLTFVSMIHPAFAWIFGIGVPLYYLWDQGTKRQKLRVAQEEQSRYNEMLQRQAAYDAAQAAMAAAAAARAAADAATRAAQQRAWSQAQPASQPRPQPARQQSQPRQEAGDARWQSSDPYAVLGVPRGSDFAAVRVAYAALSKQYHPDRVASLGQEFRDLAEARMRVINAAYEQLRGAHGR